MESEAQRSDPDPPVVVHKEHIPEINPLQASGGNVLYYTVMY